ncbi:hypothetical protein Cs7R123_66550 [Catellatospora sp. TT07R-123]|uniref:hypothetical protein n=1 Tax=Catellatospora sp. TT07R-123 TaxID=2733863 RepID=UPI001B1113A8|nr:hypothetical protein [Catellatospora sp. TT07R-123]GHJ49313.1 hypothetical protein Cs7R123_66550 [Catellatospora sp. TT07R-123]
MRSLGDDREVKPTRTPAVGAADGRRSVEVRLLALQRAAGNAAVCSSLTGGPPPGSPPPTLAVQRCGGEVHEGCPCASETENGPVAARPVQRVSWPLVAGGVLVVGTAAYLAWAAHCLDPLLDPMKTEAVRFRAKHHRDTGRPVASRKWDAFGHCWIGCAGTKKCGATATAVVGQSRELLREMGFGGPHDSYRQDTNNQATGRGYGDAGADCFAACDTGVRSSALDLSAPESTCYTADDGDYPAPCEPPPSEREQP